MLSRQECLDLAAKDEEAAARASTEVLREHFRKLAEDWRRLAERSPDDQNGITALPAPPPSSP